MNKFNLESAKFVSIIIGICLIFVMVVWHAFGYLPNKSSNNQLPQEEVVASEEQNLEEESERAEQIEELSEDDEAYKERIAAEEARLQEEARAREIQHQRAREAEEVRNVEPLESISDDEINNQETIKADNKFEEQDLSAMLNKAQEYVGGEKYALAISECQKALNIAPSAEEKALCLEKMAEIYAIQKRYGSAMSAAQKAFNAAPNTRREVLLARLYYKTGDVNRANARMSNVLKRDFLTNDK